MQDITCRSKNMIDGSAHKVINNTRIRMRAQLTTLGRRNKKKAVI